MKFMRIVLLLFLALSFACGQRTTEASLAQHTVVSNTSLAPKNGHRIEIHVNNAGLTKDECRTIINAYRKDAGPEDQVSVRKPDKQGKFQPWGVDNMDGKGVVFNDFYFR